VDTVLICHCCKIPFEASNIFSKYKKTTTMYVGTEQEYFLK